MTERIKELLAQVEEEVIQARRDFHKYPEVGWTEFRTTAVLVKALKEMGYEVEFGAKVIAQEAMMGIPAPAVLAKHMERAVAQGADPEIVKEMAGGLTGLVATLKCGEGPTVALRFDIDANDISEAKDSKHRPFVEGFASVNDLAMHACGHDGHAAVGLGVARILMELRDELKGTIKLIFQPGEEGSRGGSAMEAAGILAGVDYIFGGHIGFQAKKLGDIVCGTGEFLATTKYDVTFTGQPAHAGAFPEQGKNALLAAAAASLNLHAISRHGAGPSRINVGVLQAGQGRNVIPPNALLKLETRGVTSEIDAFMSEEARRIIAGSALTWGVEYEITKVGGTKSGTSDPEMIELVKEIAQTMGCFQKITDYSSFGATEDFSHLMSTVQEKGGKGTYFMVGADMPAGHHDFYFDFDEKALAQLTELMVRIPYKMLKK